ncbi:MAG: fatty acid desaturase [Synechococcaceae cyanobacterium]|nr:fatty acid desaturase [Synechococcaceae cyanobacterium]
MHRTVFRSRALNDAVAWLMGLLSFYNATFYRRYHQWHHRYTHQPGLDPELEDPPPSSAWGYALELSGWNWWTGKLRGHARLLWGDLEALPYMSPELIPLVRRSARLQWAVYGLLAIVSLIGADGLLFWSWLLPQALAHPYLLQAAVLAAGLDGIERRLDPGPRHDNDNYAAPLAAGSCTPLPRSPGEALAALAADRVLRAALGEPFCQAYERLRRRQWEASSASLPSAG